jgi:pyruvate, orthophosphate dikinase
MSKTISLQSTWIDQHGNAELILRPVVREKWVYLLSDGSAQMRDLLGGKGAGLAEMVNIGLPVPPGFVLSTQTCNAYAKDGKLPDGAWTQVEDALRVIEHQSQRRFGDPEHPLLVAVRSGAKFSMPGMMDSVLNIGLNDETLKGLSEQSRSPHFAYDAYRRLIQMFGKVVLGVDAHKFEAVLEELKTKRHVTSDGELTTEDLQNVAGEYKAIVQHETSQPFPQDVMTQLRLAIEAVFRSWNGRRAVDYRAAMKIPNDLGTAASVMMMVFGNMGEGSASGVAFTRNPATGENSLYGEYLNNAQGEDVVAGIRTPKPIAQLKVEQPQVYEQFAEICRSLEQHYRDTQDVEFTIEEGKLYMLQTRTAKRTAQAAAKIAIDLADEGTITRDTAVARITPAQVDMLLHPRFDALAKKHAEQAGRLLTKGLNASPGAAVGAAVFDADRAVEWAKGGRAVILVRPETTPDDVHGMLVAKGILTQHGGGTSHAAVVARGIGLPCVSGCEGIAVDLDTQQFRANGITVIQGETISIDGTSGEVFLGAVETLIPKFEEQTDLVKLLGWADRIRTLGVWANADYPRDAERALAFGAQGIGLCRTEHMFFETDRLPIVREMILAADTPARQLALDKLLPIQREDFKGILRAMAGKPVIIRLIDPPLHEFLPPHDELLAEVITLRVRGNEPERLAAQEKLLKVVESMREMNPMLGLRGVRLGILYPEIIRMQVRAIVEAACELQSSGIKVCPEIMIPLTIHYNELKTMRTLTEAVAQQVMAERGVEIEYKFGTMIEVPRAALTADQIAKYAQFFSFGTNDLTQTTLGISRDDAEGKFLLSYVKKGLLPANPFQQLDVEGVGQLIKLAVERGRRTNPSLEVGICGEHGGDPASIAFCHQTGLSYVSCSPFRVPVARLAAAQAALGESFRDV